MNPSRRTVAQLGLAALVCLAAACSDGSEETGASGAKQDISQSQLDGKSYVLESVTGSTPLAGVAVSLSFVRNEARFRAACNSAFSTYDLDDGHLLLDAIGSTAIGCDPTRQAQDAYLQQLMASAPALELEGDRLTLRGSEATLVFVDRDVAQPDFALAGSSWSLESFIDRDTASSATPGALASVRFQADGTLAIDTTCNTGSGTYQVAGNQLVLSDVMYTELGCQGGPEVTEARVQQVFTSGTLSFEVQGTVITFKNGDKAVGGSRK